MKPVPGVKILPAAHAEVVRAAAGQVALAAEGGVSKIQPTRPVLRSTPVSADWVKARPFIDGQSRW